MRDGGSEWVRAFEFEGPPRPCPLLRRAGEGDVRCTSLFVYASTAVFSAAVNSLHAPGGRLPSENSPICTRIRRRVGCPTEAVMRRTWRFFPSASSIAIQQSGTDLRKR